MKTIIRIAAITIIGISLSNCAIKEETPDIASPARSELVLTATRESVSPDTKTVRMEDGSVWWHPTEEISVFYGSGNGGGSKFTSLNTTLQDIVEFGGSVQMTGSAKDFWAVYPYAESNACDGNSITMFIPDAQTGSEGNFSGDVFPAMAKSKVNVFAFWNICGGVKFFVSRSDIKSVTFKGNNGEALAGKVRVSFNADGKPEVAEVLDGKTEVTLNAPDGGVFKVGKYYYLALLPTVLDAGFTMTFNTATETGSVVSDKTQTIKRSTFGVLKGIDSKVSKWETTWVEPEAVDLGLSVKWATFNVGAIKPEEYGDYFAWGETKPKSDYNLSTYIWCNDDIVSHTKYVIDSQWGTVDNKIVLDAEDDAAKANWGGNWRMPTDSEWRELMRTCTSTWTNNYQGTEVAGRIVTSNQSNNSIFIPAAGFKCNTPIYSTGPSCAYWSSSLSTDRSDDAWSIRLASVGVNMSNSSRYYGLSVRPVYDDRTYPESVILNKSSTFLYVSHSEQLTATVLPENAADKSVFWSSNNTGIATVDDEGNVKALAAGTATITVTTTLGGKSATCEVTVSELPNPEYVDLGLPSGLKWATWNVGAAKPEEYGDYFAWGETKPKSTYKWSTYIWCNGSSTTFTKYNTDPARGTVDNKVILDLEDDAARASWGGNWRMPTDPEWTELKVSTTMTWTSDYNGTGVAGTIVTSNVQGYMDKSIFLPAGGFMNGSVLDARGSFGGYWSSSLNIDNNYCAWDMECNSSGAGWLVESRYLGQTIRPVYDDRIPPESISLNKTSLSLYVGDSEQLIETVSPDGAANKVFRFSTNTEVATINGEGYVTGVKPGTATIVVTTNVGGKTAKCEVTVSAPDYNGYAYVDLGLPSGLKWATCNVGASKPEENGDYFAWGETDPKSVYEWTSYKWCDGDYNKLIRYCTKSSYWNSPEPLDYKTTLDLEDDAARANWGGSWRMPTDAEWTELRNNCIWTWTIQSGVNGRLVTSKTNSNSIFLPPAVSRDNMGISDAGAYGGYYWSSFLDKNGPDSACGVYFGSGGVYRRSYYRFVGFSVRAVSE